MELKEKLVLWHLCSLWFLHQNQSQTELPQQDLIKQWKILNCGDQMLWQQGENQGRNCWVINTFTENIHKPNKQKIGLVWCQLGKDCREAVELHAEKSGLLVGSFIKTIIKIRIMGHMINLLWAWKNQHVFCKMSLINQRTGKANQTPGLGCFSIYGIFKFSNSFRQGPLPQLLKTTDLSWSEK